MADVAGLGLAVLCLIGILLLAVGLVREDVERRGADEKLAALALVPLFGPLAWLLVRPSLNEA